MSAADSRTRRRDFLKCAAAGALGMPAIVPASVLAGRAEPPPSDRIRMGVIGVGGRGGSVLPEFLACPEVQMVALCDVRKAVLEDRLRIVDAHDGTRKATGYSDFRELLGRDDIDAVYIATPTHWHVPIALAAVRRGKDVYMEKPVGLAVEQAQLLREAVHRHHAIFQLGTQQRSAPEFRHACELVRNGRIGKLLRIKVGVPGGIETPSFPEMPVPDGVDWDRWLGPAPFRPFTANLLEMAYHERVSDFVPGGYINAWGIHHLDIAQWGHGTDLTGPAEVEGTAAYPKAGLADTALTWNVDLRFSDGVTVNFTDDSRNRVGIRFEGEAGWVFVHRGILETEPAGLAKETIGDGKIHLAGHDMGHDSHPRNFVECVRTRKQPNAPIDVAVRSDTLTQLSDIAVRLGRKLRWDPAAERFIGDAAANRMLSSYPLRAPWRI